MKTLKDLFLDEIADMYDAERRIVKALPKLVKAATSEKLKAALLAHLQETEGHVTKLVSGDTTNQPVGVEINQPGNSRK